mmetsp:Transcript_96466/g.268069  ORF Transcript_96466/g.268069 Transcript_96466/m.268069 type:complete len:81 (+) Transcript_96466:318-560(+)
MPWVCNCDLHSAVAGWRNNLPSTLCSSNHWQHGVARSVPGARDAIGCAPLTGLVDAVSLTQQIWSGVSCWHGIAVCAVLA